MSIRPDLKTHRHTYEKTVHNSGDKESEFTLDLSVLSPRIRLATRNPKFRCVEAENAASRLSLSYSIFAPNLSAAVAVTPPPEPYGLPSWCETADIFMEVSLVATESKPSYPPRGRVPSSGFTTRKVDVVVVIRVVANGWIREVDDVDAVEDGGASLASSAASPNAMYRTALTTMECTTFVKSHDQKPNTPTVVNPNNIDHHTKAPPTMTPKNGAEPPMLCSRRNGVRLSPYKRCASTIFGIEETPRLPPTMTKSGLIRYTCQTGIAMRMSIGQRTGECGEGRRTTAKRGTVASGRQLTTAEQVKEIFDGYRPTRGTNAAQNAPVWVLCFSSPQSPRPMLVHETSVVVVVDFSANTMGLPAFLRWHDPYLFRLALHHPRHPLLFCQNTNSASPHFASRTTPASAPLESPSLPAASGRSCRRVMLHTNAVRVVTVVQTIQAWSIGVQLGTLKRIFGMHRVIVKLPISGELTSLGVNMRRVVKTGGVRGMVDGGDGGPAWSRAYWTRKTRLRSRTAVVARTCHRWRNTAEDMGSICLSPQTQCRGGVLLDVRRMHNTANCRVPVWGLPSNGVGSSSTRTRKVINLTRSTAFTHTSHGTLGCGDAPWSQEWPSFHLGYLNSKARGEPER
ncbi:uncharacterized protein EV422DRAFT_507083 [Fimicolochytrium jonesii]|uniref:uncharacterized protein n=1 Tax=Fimicolochytrium jonesii TaxID=1396493 RepID=UPI0022FF1121|nr:uncharacterized protein EV422DRAFT_507083 [Fimicolochytrium jonesii]KAI8819900.1 hypothetical protein EV422DRAFT_507083 [Fimicolochytrium jonesii]